MLMHPHLVFGPYFGLFPLVVFALWFVAIGIPIMQIIHKAGYSRVWILIGFVPLVNLIFLWIFAFSRWPAGGRD